MVPTLHKYDKCLHKAGYLHCIYVISGVPNLGYICLSEGAHL